MIFCLSNVEGLSSLSTYQSREWILLEPNTLGMYLKLLYAVLFSLGMSGG